MIYCWHHLLICFIDHIFSRGPFCTASSTTGDVHLNLNCKQVQICTILQINLHCLIDFVCKFRHVCSIGSYTFVLAYDENSFAVNCIR